MGRYSKLIAAIFGNLVAFALAWASVQFPAISTCTIGPDGTDACSLFGTFSQAQITAGLVLLVNSFFVYQAPPNDPPA